MDGMKEAGCPLAGCAEQDEIRAKLPVVEKGEAPLKGVAEAACQGDVVGAFCHIEYQGEREQEGQAGGSRERVLPQGTEKRAKGVHGREGMLDGASSA
jgi:hypothetical protein